MKNIDKLKKTVVDNGYCIGCGACAFVSNGQISIKKNSNGLFEALIPDNIENDIHTNILDICPFYNNEYNENVIGKELYSNYSGIKHTIYTGYYLSCYAGYVKIDNYRKNGSSGGFGSWIAAKLLEEGLVDKVIHVKTSTNSELLFDYQFSNNIQEIQEGSKSRYYPIEMSSVLEYVSNNDYKYLFVGIPCFIKALRQLQKTNPLLKQRIKFTLGLVCGHLKSDFFSKSMAWELGIDPQNLKGIDFRVKNQEKTVNNYSIKVTGQVDGEIKTMESLTKNLFVSNWGHGLFKYKACDYCDDVLSETADVAIGDAWLPEYSKDSLGTNIIVIRHETINNLFTKYKDEINVDIISSDQVYKSQSGGFRHRREGLQYRIFLSCRGKDWFPIKRFSPSNHIPNKRKKIYEKRIELTKQSFISFNQAIEKNDFNVLRTNLLPLINEYNKIYRDNRVLSFIKKIYKKIKTTKKHTKLS